MVKEILDKQQWTKEDIVALLLSKGEERGMLFKKAAEIKQKEIGNTVYFRGLVEFSNRCVKNCFYCGVRSGNRHVNRYSVTDEEVLEAAGIVMKERYGSMVLQSGERSDKAFTDRITRLVKKIKEISDGKIGITLSCGEQSDAVYRQWFEAGAHRYLLRIETSNKELYKKIHPEDKKHSYEERLVALDRIRQAGYQLGTGVMIGLPFQTTEDLAEDLLFIQRTDVDMVGMGPYIEHKETPLYQYKELLLPGEQRFDLALKMIAILRIIMKDINIAATTAMQTLDPQGREKALMAGANIIMPNLTPLKYRENYLLYQNKPGTDENAEQTKNNLEERIRNSGHQIGYEAWGDSKHFMRREKDRKL